jgi:uncharacterized protein DUF4262
MPLHPDEAKRRNLLRRLKKDIAKHGHSVMYIFGEGGAPPFFYTIGRAKKGLPELLLILPLQPETGMRLLNYIAQMMPEPLPSGSLVDLGGRYPMKLIDADDRIAKEDYTCLATDINGGEDKYRVQQVIGCDEQGRFPPNCGPPYHLQPILQTLN